MTTVLELKNITKRFGSLVANDHISISLKKGEIHALLGENGAGKSTLMNILYGLYHPEEGEIYVNGKPVTISDPGEAIGLGIGMVHQHFMLAPVLTVTDNVIIGDEMLRGGIFLDRKLAAQQIRELSSAHHLEVNPDDYVRDLPVGLQQRVEIIKLLFREAEFLILDEPTAVLTPQEIEGLFQVLRSLAADGKSIIFITHKLKEVLSIADRISVLQHGKLVGTALPSEVSESDLARMMVGREVVLNVKKEDAQPAEPILQIEDLLVLTDQKTLAVDHLSLEVRSGEIVGIAGVQGNGQSELVEALTGLRPALNGEVHICGEEMTKAPPRKISEKGVAHIPEDRQQTGLVLESELTTNMVLCSYYKPPFSQHGFLNQEAIESFTTQQVEDYDVRTTSIHAEAGDLSGGNQQKVIIAREFSRPLKLLIASQPTRGLDVGSIEFVHRNIVEKRDNGCAVLVVSSELDEILSLADRIAVMFRGKIVAILDAKDATKENLGLLMAGVVPEKQN